MKNSTTADIAYAAHASRASAAKAARAAADAAGAPMLSEAVEKSVQSLNLKPCKANI